MARLLSVDAVLMGRLSSYTIGKELHRAADEGAVYLARNRSGEKCIVKSIRGHWRLRNEADILKRYQYETPFLRPLVDDIHDPADPPSIVLRYLDSDVLTESNKKRLSRPEIKQVARCVLEALRLLHKDGMVHTDVKLDNIFATFQLPWGTATDIWSFGTAMLSLVFGGGYHLFNPKIEKVEPGSDEYEFTDTMAIINFINAQGSPAKPFHRVGPREVPPADMEFILKIMKLDPRDRPTAEELLADVWFTEESQDTRDPLPGEELRSEAKQCNLAVVAEGECGCT
ncbi:kinase-like domain-containing protein [Cercophora newfieldiana]|uniref:Kinase-like domain-containing protein n=1 Tax=Cercophora newfieldiana TaxID=92897 RepID=A0AA39YAW5_9PEZI|nr:kinase-like domain-containing protein [Cercophora newfieldiana]